MFIQIFYMCRMYIMSLARQLNFDNVDRESVGTVETVSYPASPLHLPPPPVLDRSRAIVPGRLSRASSVSGSTVVIDDENDHGTIQRSYQAIANNVRNMIPSVPYSDRVRRVREHYINVENESSSNVDAMHDSTFHIETDENIREEIRKEIVYGIYDDDALYEQFGGQEIVSSNDEMVLAVLRHPQFKMLFTPVEFDKLVSFLQLEQQIGGRKKHSTRRTHKRNSRKSAGKRKSKRNTHGKRGKRSKTVKRKTNKKNRNRSSRRHH